MRARLACVHQCLESVTFAAHWQRSSPPSTTGEHVQSPVRVSVHSSCVPMILLPVVSHSRTAGENLILKSSCIAAVLRRLILTGLLSLGKRSSLSSVLVFFHYHHPSRKEWLFKTSDCGECGERYQSVCSSQEIQYFLLSEPRCDRDSGFSSSLESFGLQKPLKYSYWYWSV